MSKPGKPRKAPRVAIPSRKKPNIMKEFDSKVKRKSPQQPMKTKRLSK